MISRLQIHNIQCDMYMDTVYIEHVLVYILYPYLRRKFAEQLQINDEVNGKKNMLTGFFRLCPNFVNG